ncbi:MAG: BatA domain-containing protein, partial [Bacteroidota bacterium]
MTFLNPAILFGLFAAAIPLALHFLNLRKLKKIEFSTLAFLKELQKTKIKRLKLKQWLLLLLRIAVIILLVMAFARPTVKSFSIGNSAAAKTTAVIIIDNTFSMSVVNEKGSYLNRSKQIAKSLLGNFQDGDEILLLTVGELQYEILKQAKKIDEIQISFVSKTLDEALVKAAQFLHQSKNFNKEIYLFTDLQKGRVFNSAKEISSLSGILNNNTRLYLIDVAGKEAINLGIEGLKTDNQIFEKGKTVGFRTIVKNYSNKNVNSSVVSIFVGGKRSAQQSLNLSSGETKEIFFETTLADTGLVEVYSELEDDDILQDNKRFFAFYVPDKISLMILTDNREDAKFVKYAVENNSRQKIRIAEYSSSQLSSLNLKNYDLVFVIGSEKIFNMQNGQLGWNNLTNYIERGGKVVVMPGSQNTIQSFQKLCNAIGVAVPAISVGERNSLESLSLFDKVDFQNPLFTDLFENKKEPQIESPEVYYYFKIVPGSKGKNIISLFDNSAFLS